MWSIVNNNITTRWETAESCLNQLRNKFNFGLASESTGLHDHRRQHAIPFYVKQHGTRHWLRRFKWSATYERFCVYTQWNGSQMCNFQGIHNQQVAIYKWARSGWFELSDNCEGRRASSFFIKRWIVTEMQFYVALYVALYVAVLRCSLWKAGIQLQQFFRITLSKVKSGTMPSK